jgi:hypothetical protein
MSPCRFGKPPQTTHLATLELLDPLPPQLCQGAVTQEQGQEQGQKAHQPMVEQSQVGGWVGGRSKHWKFRMCSSGGHGREGGGRREALT